MVEKRRLAVGYIRVSTEAQAGEDKYGVDAQRAAILEYAEKNGYSVCGIYTDEVSGVKDERPELDRILYADALPDGCAAVIVYKNDRVARDTKLYFYYLFLLEKRGVKLLSTKEEFGEDDAFANVYRALIMFVAEQERRNILARTLAARKEKAATGGYAGALAAYGYKNDGKSITVVDDEAKVVRIIFKLYDSGCSLGYIARWLNSRGYPPRGHRGGSKWQPCTVRGIVLRRPFYAGCYKWGKGSTYVLGAQTPILDEDPTQYFGLSEYHTPILADDIRRAAEEKGKAI